MPRVGFVGWRGMVGSVLLQRMRDEGDLDDLESTFFTTSNVGGPVEAWRSGSVDVLTKSLMCRAPKLVAHRHPCGTLTTWRH